MPLLSKIVSTAPDRLRARVLKRAPAVVAAINKDIDKILGVQGTPEARSKPGEAPRRQTGRLQRGTRAAFNPKDLSIHILTTQVGLYLNQGTRRMAARPFKDRILAAAKPHLKKLTSWF